MMRALYKEKLINSYGIEFQNKVCNLLQQYYGDKFKRICSYGNDGDKKNDGFIEEKGIFFQIYGPIENTISSQQQAIKKLKKDFNGLDVHCNNGYWTKINKFYFVYNDKGNGISPALNEEKKYIREQSGIECEIIGIDALMTLYDKLDVKQQNILNENYEFDNDKDKNLYLEIKEVFYISGLYYELENFIFGQQLHNNSFTFGDDNFAVADYIDRKIKSPYFKFINDEELEKLREQFIYYFYNFINKVSLMYFSSHTDTNCYVTKPRNLYSQEEIDFLNRCQKEAFISLKQLLEKGYEKYKI